MWRRMIVLVAVVAAGWWFMTLPNNHREHRKVRSSYDQAHSVNKKSMDDSVNPVIAQMKTDRKVDRAGLWNALKPGVNESVGLDNDENALHSRLDRLVPLHRQPIVQGYELSPTTYFPAFEPILVVMSRDDQICNGYRSHECAHADGIYQEGLPGEHKNKKTVLQVPKYGGDPNSFPGNYMAHIARVCNNGVCGEWVQTGFVYAVCQPGNEQQWFNGFAQIGRLVHTEDMFGGRGKFSFDAAPHPLARAACAENPDADIVPNLELPLEPLDPGIPVSVATN